MADITRLKFRGDKDAKGQPLGVNHYIDKLVNGAIINQYGVRIGSYRRLTVDGGASQDVQELEITLEVDD